jgi:hypothetical protein
MLMLMRELDSSGSGWPLVAGSCECSDEPLGPTNGGEILDQQSDCWHLKKDSVPLS